jgi:signal transduction histidine kinase
MLRHKLLVILFSLTSLLMVLAVAALWSLQLVFVDLDHLHNRAAVAVNQVNELSTTLSGIEVELYALQTGRQHHLDGLIDSVETMHRLSQLIGTHDVLDDPQVRQDYDDLIGRIDGFDARIGVLSTAQDRELARSYNLAALDAASQMRRSLLRIARHIQAHAQTEQVALTGRFRWLVVAMAIGFLIVINGSILLMMRAAGMILRPVARLVHASRELARENFAHRVTVGQQDEFDELARAYNDLAEKLQEHEYRRVQALQQMALSLNHELNNAIATIELQLTLLRRRSGPDVALEKNLSQIHDNLRRMAEVISSLKQLRRVVLTDYADGVKMLDLRESIREDGPASSAG